MKSHCRLPIDHRPFRERLPRTSRKFLLTPPAARGIGKPSDPLRATPAPSFGDFTRTSPELFAKLRLGWNLGNSLDVPNGETAWGNPMATPELLVAVAKAGFNLVRIPVTWAQHLGPAPSYAIDPDWLARVEEVVGYARSAGLYSIINSHHEGGWLSLKDANGNTTQENNALVRAQFVAVWTQIAKYFANQGEELMFESVNEVHDGYGKADPRHIEIVNDLDQAFVNLVRASGGNNGRRHLIVPGYNTNIDETLKGFKLPTDSAKNRLILSVHCYDPYLYALMGRRIPGVVLRRTGMIGVRRLHPVSVRQAQIALRRSRGPGAYR